MGNDELEYEQKYVSALYEVLDQRRERAAGNLAGALRTPIGTPAGRTERDAFVALHEDRLATLRAVEDRLVFGRLDLDTGTTRYIGRIGLSDDDQRQLLVDWRAPAAESFYQATAAAPLGVVRRRHISTRGRNVVGLEDDVLDLDALNDEQQLGLVGEGALLASLDARRTGRMRDIVATIQAEQDRIIRAPMQGVLVVQGGPGTGKTVVALHRAAYLLYTYRERIARSGVLIVGPNPTFLRYIEQVLPSLGETGAVMVTPGRLFPGVDADGVDDPRVAALKGDARMANVIATAIRRRQRVPDRPVPLDVDGHVIDLQPQMVAAARARARRTRKPHNEAGVGFVKDVLNNLAAQLAESLGMDLDEDSRPGLIADLRASADVIRHVGLAWLQLTPQKLIADLYARPAYLEMCAPHLSAVERALLARERDSPWTAADVPLLDEAAELLGEEPDANRAAAQQAEQRSRVAFARDVLSTSAAGSMITAEEFAQRWEQPDAVRTVAERASEDRSWAFGHVVVDEAQELSPMMWRLLFRRCPSRSMTVVGDVAQTGALDGVGAWRDVFDRHSRGNWRVEELTVNYRTPRQVMALASDVLAAAGVDVRPPDSVRDGDFPPAAERIGSGDLGAIVDAVRTDLAALEGGRIAVISSRADQAALVEALRDGLGTDVGSGRDALDAPVAVMTVADVKGLEFDGVVLYEPEAIVSESPRGANDLYVALTRPTQRLRVLYSGELPYGLMRLAA